MINARTSRFFGAALLACAPAALMAQTAKAYPDKPIRVVVSVPAGGTPAELSVHLASERRKIGGLIRAAGIKPE